MNRTLIISIIISLCLPAISAGDIKIFNYADANTESLGTGRKENYDVAVRLSDPTLSGAKITGISISPLPEHSIDGCSIWLTGELRLEDKVNTPDIASFIPANVDGRLMVTLDEPVVIPDDGIYVGYSFNITELTPESEEPLSVSVSDNSDAFFIHTSRTYLKWGNYGLDYAADIAVTLEGDFFDDAVAVVSLSDTGALHGTPVIAKATIRNHGNSPVSSIDYTCEMADRSVERHIEFPEPLPAAYTADRFFTVELDAMEEAGSYPLSVTVTKVNGSKNCDKSASIDGKVYIYPYLPEHRPLVEEFTGLWCGWCPRGSVGMEKMNENFPGRFVGIAYHTRDDVMNSGCTLPRDMAAPSALLDRSVVTDPYNGDSESVCVSFIDGIGSVWSRQSEKVSVADLSAISRWADDSRTVIDVTAEARFVREYDDSDFCFGYILTADGIHGEGTNWMQSNYYSGNTDYSGTDLAPLVNAGRYIENMTFDDVVVLAPDNLGVEGSIESRIDYLANIKHTYRFDISEAVNTEGLSLIQDKNRLNVVTFIVDKESGEIVNAFKSHVTADSGIENTANDCIVKDVIYYSCTGQRISMPYYGFCIRKTIYSDGSSRSEKIMLQ